MCDRQERRQGCSVMPPADGIIQGRIPDCGDNLLDELVRRLSRSESFTMRLDKITMLLISQLCLSLWCRFKRVTGSDMPSEYET